MKNKKVLPAQAGFIIPILIILALVILGIIAYFFSPKSISLKLPTNLPKATVSPTSTSDPTANWKTYITVDKLLSFKVPSEFMVRQEKGHVGIKSKDDSVVFVDYTTDGSSPRGYSGTSAGDYVDGGKINFLGDNIQKTKIVFDNILTSNLFGGKVGNTNFNIEIKNFKFIIGESFATSIKGNNPLEATFDQILSTFKFTN